MAIDLVNEKVISQSTLCIIDIVESKDLEKTIFKETFDQRVTDLNHYLY